ncbi:hypothetical protein IGS75_08140 [Gluconobacter sphaericus]|uniref:hypothetical protein n=1 Tax=Gluconobacter sphaericus TaxID=574987 RepID=UPI00192394AE|nr:hypothetical protein [Gluconobacter sphaericus]QQX90207.1 hypothetical protein IGS75_08140 [Gluconobacter sphaericus]
MTLYLERSKPRKEFKNLLGHANHLIITALVGLDGIERGVINDVPKDLRTVWSPKDAVISAKRSRRLILDMALIRAIDAIDVYLREAVRKPALIQLTSFRRDLDSAGLSIFKKMLAVEKHYPNLGRIPVAIVFLMIAWRNRGAHTEADLDAPQIYLDILKDNARELAERFSGLDAEMLLGGYDAVRPVTFKEVASLINAAHQLVAELDTRLLTSLDIELFLKDVVWTSLSDSQKLNERIDQARKRRAVSIWGKDPSDRGDAVLRFLGQQGFSKIRTGQQSGAVISEDLTTTLSQLTPKSVLRWANPPS